MTGKERMWNAITGAPVDRPPIWLREGFDFHRPPAEADHFALGWQADPEYRKLWDFAREVCDQRIGWAAGGHFNRWLGISPRHIHGERREITPDLREIVTTLDTPGGPLTAIARHQRGENTTWQVKYPVESMADLQKLRSVPFEVAPVNFANYERLLNEVGDTGVLCLGLSSPWVTFSTCMSYEQALIWSATEPAMVHETLHEITERYLACLEAILARPLDTIANIGGCEQCTPPMMGPEAFAEFVTPYDGRLVARLRQAGIPVNCHCHGRVRHALPEIVAMGYSSTDPVEPPFGGGDLSMADARAIVGGRLTLCGNFQFDELAHATPEQIRGRVREIRATGSRRLVLAASAGPISRITPTMAANYRAWIEEALV
jgi:uroporphyrinogen-III decarboxylase